MTSDELPRLSNTIDVCTAAAATLERPVVNCLGCGKIYDCRSVTSDIARFLGEHQGLSGSLPWIHFLPTISYGAGNHSGAAITPSV